MLCFLVYKEHNIQIKYMKTHKHHANFAVNILDIIQQIATK